MNLMKKENLRPIVVLTVICVVVAALLSGINMITGPIIKAAQAAAVQESLLKVMPDGEFDEKSDELRSDAPVTIKEVYTEKNGKGYVVVVQTNKGYTGKNIGFTVAVGKDGGIINLLVTQNEESIVPADMKPGGSYGDSYKGATADTVADVVTGATVKYTESAIKSALNDVFTYLEFKEPDPELPRTDEELLTLAYEMVEGVVSFTDVTPENTELVKRVYRENSGKGYVIYAHTYAAYGGTLETETMVHVDNEGKIISVNKLLWKVSDHPDYIPPTENAVNTFYQGLTGRTSEDIANVELVSGATNTSTNVRDAMTEVLSTVEELLKTDVSMTEAELMALAKELVGDDAEFTNLTPGNIELVKRIYRENSGKGYVVLVQTISKTYGTVDTSNLIYVDNDGKIKAAKKLVWKVSDPLYGFVPPSKETVDAFYDRIIDKNEETVGIVEFITGATNTSTSLMNSIKEALRAVVSLNQAYGDIAETNTQNGGNI